MVYTCFSNTDSKVNLNLPLCVEAGRKVPTLLKSGQGAQMTKRHELFYDH
jgi:hypothetical protein